METAQGREIIGLEKVLWYNLGFMPTLPNYFLGIETEWNSENIGN